MSDVVDLSDLAAEEPRGLAFEPGSKKDKSSRFWRGVWRVHFYAGMAVLPFLVILAVTGTAVLYKDIINSVFEGDILTVIPSGAPASLENQVAVVAEQYPEYSIGGVTPPATAERSTMVAISKSEDETLQVYVDPYTSKLLGTKVAGQDIPSTMERVHGSLLMDWTVSVPTLAGVTGQADTVFSEIAFGDLLVELMAGWGVVLIVSGLYLWWPRKRESGKALFKPRLNKKGRAFWRDLHAIPGALFSLLLLFLIVTGLPWSGFWGGNWDHVITRAEQGYNFPDTPPSEPVKVGDLDRFGNPIPWATQSETVPASASPATETATAQQVGLDAVAKVAQEEGMLSGYSISLPEDLEAEDGGVAFGVYSLGNPWPAAAVDERTVFVDQFTGETVSEYGMGANGVLADATAIGIDTHMGTQFGLVNRIIMTIACVGVVWGAFSGLMMWWKRRPKKSAGLPRRPNDVHLQRGMIILAVVIGVIFPLVGISMLLILALDKFVIRKIPRLRKTFGMR